MKLNPKVGLTVIITILTIAFTAFIVFKSVQEANFEIDASQSQLIISGGLYGKTIDLNENVEITMIEPLEIKRKTNGAAIGNVKSGYFTLADDTKVYLNLGNDNHEWIAIIDEDDQYYINLKDEDETLNLYNELLDLIDNN